MGTGLRRAEVTGLDLDQLDPAGPAQLRRVKKARLNGVRGKGCTSRTVFLGRDARQAIADYLESERPGDADEQSDALFLAASSIGARRPGGSHRDRSTPSSRRSAGSTTPRPSTANASSAFFGPTI